MMIKVAGINLQALNSLDFLANYFRRLSILQMDQLSNLYGR
jgi:hypothetical protein